MKHKFALAGVLVSANLFIAANLIFAKQNDNATKKNAFVNRIYDGDTVSLTIAGEKSVTKYRLIGIDAPEHGQDYAETSKARLAELINKKNVTVQDCGSDKYNRHLGFIYLDGQDINLQMVREGMAWHYAHFYTNTTYAAMEKEARLHRRGLWSNPNPIEPFIFRKGGLPK